MATEAVVERRSAGHRLADLFHGRPRLQVGALLAGPVGWLVIGYLGSLAILLIAAFWTVNPLSGEVVEDPQLRKLRNALQRTGLPDDHLADRRASRPLVTVTDAMLAFPIAFYMAKVASRRGKAILVVADPAAALVELSGQGLRLANDALRRRRHRLGAASRSACTARATG